MEATRTSTESDASTRNTVSVCGIDRSGSYDFVEAGLELCLRLVESAVAGDVVVLRWVSETSYRNQELVARLDFSRFQLVDCSDNPFSRRCQREGAAVRRALEATRAEHLERLRGLRPSSAPMTDIHGFLQAAADEFAADTLARDHRLYLATDLQENVHHRVDPPLSGVVVTVLAFETGSDPAEGVRIRQAWEARLRELGASQVRFEVAGGVR